MTTTSTFQGMNEEAKPSSRVLRPPGGGSSNIFGPPEPVQPSPSKPYQRSNLLGGAEPAAQPAQTAQTKQDDVPKDRLFGDAPQKESPKPASNARQDCAAPQDDKPADTKPEPTNNNFAEKPQGQSPQTRPNIMYRGSTVLKPQQRGAYNPITGEAYDKPAEKVNSAPRGRQPPGGASSGIF